MNPFDETLFLGPHAESMPRAAGLLHEALVAHAQWRRDAEPAAGPRVARYDVAEEVRAALGDLSDDLRRSVPYWSPRYLGHMAAEPLLPATLAKMIAGLYNQNNIAEESAPATVAREREVIAALLAMVGMRGAGAFGHLTAGGTVANYEGLWHLRAARFYGLALARGVAACDAPASVRAAAAPLADRSPWELVNLPLDALLALRAGVLRAAHGEGPSTLRRLDEAVARHRYEHLGALHFHRSAPELGAPVVLLPMTAHYSWGKAANLLGLGADQVVRVPTDARMRMRPDALAEQVAELGRARVPVIATVGVVACTQFGAIDPVDQILAVRDLARADGCDFGLHLDAAWGGFLMTLMRGRDGGTRALAAVQAECGGFPDADSHRALSAVARADSVTVDPHKQGFVPFGAGAYLCRDAGLAELNASDAAYVFGRDAHDAPPALSRDLGRYSLEGSRSGENAAACSVAYRVMPLDADGLGRLVAPSLRSARRFVGLLARLDARASGCVLHPFVRPETNIVCLAAVPNGVTSLRHINAMTRALAERLKHDPERVDAGGFIASTTAVELGTLAPAVGATLLVKMIGHAEPDDDHVFLLRHTLMNPLLDAPGDALDPLARYASHLAALCAGLLAPRRHDGRYVRNPLEGLHDASV
ncbi:MAG: pyridoxal-dependent decarboxylase [Myxococcota bacterium]